MKKVILFLILISIIFCAIPAFAETIKVWPTEKKGLFFKKFGPDIKSVVAPHGFTITPYDVSQMVEPRKYQIVIYADEKYYYVAKYGTSAQDAMAKGTKIDGQSGKVDDPINTLVAKLNATKGMWINGLYPKIELPSDSTCAQILAEAIKMTGFDQGHIKSYKILEVREVKLIPNEEVFSAALIESDLGMKIFLFKYEGNMGWFTRFYKVRDSME